MQKLKFPAFRLLAIIAMLFTFAAAPAEAAKNKIYRAWHSDVAVSGYDVVAYFTEGRPIQGVDSFTFSYDGATWHFSSRRNLELFIANPGHYAPQFGGHCSWAASQGYIASGNPKAWKIVDGKLYLNYSKAVQKKWEHNIPRHIAAGHKNWPKLLE